MSTLEVILWLLASLGGVAVCGLFAGLETGMYSLNRVRLHLKAQQGNPRAATLSRLVGDEGRLLATLLIGTNIATNIATSTMGVFFESQMEHHWQVILAVLLIETPLLFIFAETLPKDLFAAHADGLVYPFATPIHWLKMLFTWIGLLGLISVISALVMRRLGVRGGAMPFQPRLLVNELVKEGLGAGLVSDEQSAIVGRVLLMSGLTAGDEMVPWHKVIHVRDTVTADDLWRLAGETAATRFPVVDARGKAVGVLNINDALRCDRATCPPVRELMAEPFTLDANMPLRTALRKLQANGSALAIVIAEGVPVGVATIKDLIEPITGELVVW
jgi:CBS domain containing-hemolysin-like protein